VLQDASLDDSDAYHCHAENKYGAESASGTLSVRRTYTYLTQSLKTCLEARTCLENENPCLEKSGSVLQFFTSIFMLFYINIPFKLIVSVALRIAIKHECIFRTLTQQK